MGDLSITVSVVERKFTRNGNIVADMNIGYALRLDGQRSFEVKTLMAGKDGVAID
jgi:hypothetical protein